MATKFSGVIKRQIRLHSVQADVITRITEEGVEMSIAGKKKKLSISWEMIARASRTPGDAPSWLEGKPIEFLRHQASEVNKITGG